MKKILNLFGTRPEAIKFAPVIRALGKCGDVFNTVNVISSQHTDLLHSFVADFGIQVHHDLKVMRPNQHPSQILSTILTTLDPILCDEQPDMLLIQGDTTTALAGALAGFHRKIAVGHIEAGLRSGNISSPFPEEMNRQLISRIASLHFAATQHNQQYLIQEGIDKDKIILTGNPVIDSLNSVLESTEPSAKLLDCLAKYKGLRIIVLTTHRRESFGNRMLENLAVLREFVEQHDDLALVFPVHPNPSVREAASKIFEDVPRIELIDPLNYPDFLHLLSSAWLIVSDSGGVQEEAPTLGKPLLVLRENTERPESIQAGIAKLVGDSSSSLKTLLNEAGQEESWVYHVRDVPNPYGQGDAGERIAQALEQYF